MYHFSFLNTKQNIPVERACPTMIAKYLEIRINK